jgi:P4 family phage/plasmid primase-like protien
LKPPLSIVPAAAFDADDEDTRPQGLSDDALARRFTAAHKHHLRYCAEHGAWYVYEAGRWRKDSTLHVFEWAREICREAQDDPLFYGHLKPGVRERLLMVLMAAKTIAAVERLARSDRCHAITADMLDAQAWSLNCPGGEVDLVTGQLLEHVPGNYHTRQAAVTPTDAAACPTWLAFLGRVTGDDAEMIDYLQAVAGYALVGVVTEHVLLFLWGSGANGKTTFSNVLTGIMGDYATVAPMETFVESPGSAHPTELAMLAGARLVTATETDPGRRWATARIKTLTGGDPITARFMRGDFFTYRPRFLLILSGNHRPHLGAVDPAIKRRLHLVPFTQHIPAAERDPGLPEKLRAEWPAILAWMIEGCRRWQREGLQPPAAVTGATDDYMEGEDSVGTWLAAATVTDPYAHEPSSGLYADYCGWAEAAGERPMPLKRLVSTLEDRGLRRRATKTGKVFDGLRFKPVAERLWIKSEDDR